MSKIKVIASIWCPKGGVGKTSITLQMAHYLALGGRKVAVYDYDEQGQTSRFCRESEMPVYLFSGEPATNNLPPEDTEYILIDYPPDHEKLPMGNDIVIPCGSSPAEYEEVVNGLKQFLSQGGAEDKRFIFVPFGVVEGRVSYRLIKESFTELCQVVNGSICVIHASEAAKMLWPKRQTVFDNQNKVMNKVRADYVTLTKKVFKIRK